MATGIIKKNMVLLWENPNPNAAFQGNIIFSNDYPLYMMVFKRDKDIAVSLSTFFPNGSGAQCISGSGYYNKVYERGYSWISGGGLNGQSGGYSGGDHSASYNIGIPLRIYGIRV